MITRNSDIMVLNLSNRAKNLLYRSGINTVGKLLDKEDAELKSIHNMGTVTHAEIRNALDHLEIAQNDSVKLDSIDAMNAILGVILKSHNLQISILTALTANIQMPAELRKQTEEAAKICIALNNQTIDSILEGLGIDSDSDCNSEH